MKLTTMTTALAVTTAMITVTTIAITLASPLVTPRATMTLVTVRTTMTMMAVTPTLVKCQNDFTNNKRLQIGNFYWTVSKRKKL